MAVLVTVIVAALVGSVARPARSASATSTAVTICGSSFCVNGARWGMYGASVYNPGLTPYLSGIKNPSGTVDLAQRAHLNTIRLTNFLSSTGDPASAPYDTTAWQRVDAMIAAAQTAGMHVVLGLSDYRKMLWNDCINPYTADWGSFISFVANRVNTVTGSTYKNDPTIAFVSITGEPLPVGSQTFTAATTGQACTITYTTADLTNFYTRALSAWKAQSGSVMVNTGGLLYLDFNSGIDWKSIFALPADDFCDIKTYGGMLSWAPNAVSYCTSIGKPIVDEEFGWTQNVGDASRANLFAQTIATTQALGFAGTAFWNLGYQKGASSHEIGPGTPATFAAVQRHGIGPTAYSLWQAHHETGDTTEWTADGGGAVNLSGNASEQVVADPTNTAGHVLQLSIDTSGGAASALIGRWAETQRRRDLWYDVDYIIPQSYSPALSGNTTVWTLMRVGARKPNSTASDPMWSFSVQRTSGGPPTIRADWGSNGGSLAGPFKGDATGPRSFQPGAYTSETAVTALPAPPLPIGRRVHLSLFVHQSNNYVGEVALFQDGALLYDFTNVDTGYRNCANNSWCVSNDWAVGIASGGLTPNPAAVEIDDAEVSAIGPAPAVSTISPVTIPQGALRERIDVVGQSFMIGAVGDVAGADVSGSTASVRPLTALDFFATASANAALGPRDVTVRNPDGGVGTCAGCISVTPGPKVTSIAPTSVARGSTLQVTLNGTNFVSGATVTFGTGVTVTSVTFVSRTQLRVNVSVDAAATTGTRTVTVTNPDGGRGTCKCVSVS